MNKKRLEKLRKEIRAQEEQDRLNVLRAEWDERLQSEIQANLDSKKLTGEDYAIRINVRE